MTPDDGLDTRSRLMLTAWIALAWVSSLVVVASFAAGLYSPQLLGTTNVLAKFIGPSQIGDSSITDGVATTTFAHTIVTPEADIMALRVDGGLVMSPSGHYANIQLIDQADMLGLRIDGGLALSVTDAGGTGVCLHSASTGGCAVSTTGLTDYADLMGLRIDGGLVMAPNPSGTGACLVSSSSGSCVTSTSGSATFVAADVTGGSVNLTTEGTLDWSMAVNGNSSGVIGTPCGASGTIGNSKIASPGWFVPCPNFQIYPQASDLFTTGTGVSLTWAATAGDCSTNCTGNASSSWAGLSGHAVGSMSWRGPALPTQLVWRLYVFEFSVTAATCTLSVSDGSFSPIPITVGPSGTLTSKAYKLTATYTATSPGAYAYIYCTATLGGGSTPDFGWLWSTLAPT